MSKILEAAHELARSLHGVGAMGGLTMRQMDVPCLPIGVFLLALFLPVRPAMARDMDQTDHNSPGVRDWVTSLRNQNGVACRTTADGWRPQAVLWDFDTQGYKVQIEGNWVGVSDNAVIHGPNRLGHAEVWYYHVDGLPKVSCFLPGEGM